MDFVPLSRITWPRRRTLSRRASPFKSTYDATIQLLLGELHKIRADRVTLYADLILRDIRLDGLPRSDARSSDPGVMLTFEVKDQPVQLACDTFSDWKSNLRAIALTLEHLRTVERYGATRPGQQYRGYRPELPAGEGQTAGKPTRSPDPAEIERAENTIFEHSVRGGFWTDRSMLRDADILQRAYRAAMKVAHPDAGGSHQDAAKVNEAYELLKSVAADVVA